jgi:hypothetical protein
MGYRFEISRIKACGLTSHNLQSVFLLQLHPFIRGHYRPHFFDVIFPILITPFLVFLVVGVHEFLFCYFNLLSAQIIIYMTVIRFRTLSASLFLVINKH